LRVIDDIPYCCCFAIFGLCLGGFINGYHCRHHHCVAVVCLLFRFILGREVKKVASRIRHSRRLSDSQSVVVVM
jgi:hypothetical protein